MKIRKFMGILILVFTMASASLAGEVEDKTLALKSDNSLVVYYFHGKRRCYTCQQLEAYAQKALQNNFANELSNKTIQWIVKDTSKPENQHFIEDYSLVSQSLILVKQENGKQKQWKNLDRIWQLVRNEKAYIQYVSHNIKEFLENNNG